MLLGRPHLSLGQAGVMQGTILCALGSLLPVVLTRHGRAVCSRHHVIAGRVLVLCAWCLLSYVEIR